MVLPCPRAKEMIPADRPTKPGVLESVDGAKPG